MRLFEFIEKAIRRTDENSAVQKAAEIIGEEHVNSLHVTEGEENIPSELQ